MAFGDNGATSMSLKNTWDGLGVRPGNTGWHWNAASFPGGGSASGGWNMPSWGGGNGTGQWSSSFNAPTDRYQEIKDGYDQRYSRNVGSLDALGAVQRQNITTGFNNQSAAQQQDLTSRGLVGTTVLDTMKTGNETAKQNALAQADASLAAQKAQLDASLSGDTLAFMERYKPVNASSQGSGSGGGGGGGGYDEPLAEGITKSQQLSLMNSLLPRIAGGGTGNWSDDIQAGASRRPAAARGGLNKGSWFNKAFAGAQR